MFLFEIILGIPLAIGFGIGSLGAYIVIRHGSTITKSIKRVLSNSGK